MRTTIVSAFVLVAILFIGFMTTPQAKAATLEELQAMIAQLMAQIALMQVGPTPSVPAPTIGNSLAVGVSVQTSAIVRVRTIASVTGGLVGTQAIGQTGKITAGPVAASGYQWYRVDFITGVDGWVAGNWIKAAGVDVNSFVNTSLGADNEMQPGLEDASIAKISIAAAQVDRYANKVVLLFRSATDNNEDLPWVTFENIAVWSNGYQMFEVKASDMSAWTKTAEGYEITVFNGNQKIRAGQAYNLTVSVTTDADVIIGDRWSVSVPPKGVIIWSQLNGHMTNRFALTTYPIIITGEAAGSGVVVEPVDARANAEGENGEIGDFTVEFSVVAHDQDVYIKNTTAQSPKSAGVTYIVDGPDKENVTAAMSSLAEKDGEYYVVREGEIEDFEVNVWAKPTVTGQYRMSLANLQYSETRGGAVQSMVFTPVTEFRTPYIAIIGGVVTIASYTLADVKAVTKKTVDPIPTAIDDEYTLYRIVLLNGKVHEVKVGFMPISYRDEQFRKTGYTGDIAKLMAMATSVVSVGKITSFTATPALVPATKNGTQEVVLKWAAEGVGLCTISEYFEGSGVLKTVVSNQPSSGSLSVKPVWAVGALTVLKHYVVRCANAIEGTDIVVKLQAASTTPVVAAPGKNAFGCNRSVTTKVASGTLACYGMWDYGDDFGGDKNMCGDYSAGKRGCVIQTPVCVTGAAKATAFLQSGAIPATKLAAISTRLKVSPEVATAGIAGLWEYTCTSPITAGAVLGASTDIYTEIGMTLSSIGALLNTMK